MIVALLVLSLAAGGVVQQMATVQRQLREVQDLELQQLDADRLLRAYALLTDAELRREPVAKGVGLYVVTVHRLLGKAYRVSVSRGPSPAVEIVATIVVAHGGERAR